MAEVVLEADAEGGEAEVLGLGAGQAGQAGQPPGLVGRPEGDLQRMAWRSAARRTSRLGSRRQATSATATPGTPPFKRAKELSASSRTFGSGSESDSAIRALSPPPKAAAQTAAARDSASGDA